MFLLTDFQIVTLRKGIDQIEAGKEDAFRDYEMTLELLQEYNANEAFIQQMRILRQESADAKEETLKVKNELKTEKLFNYLGEL